MSMTMTQKIIAAHCGRENVRVGEIVMASTDMVLANDITAPIAIRELKNYGFGQVFDREKIALVMDHFTPCKDIKSAEQCAETRRFTVEQNIRHFYDSGEAGIEHALLPEKGLVGSGDLIVGADSHTCTYGALGAFSTGMGSTDIAFSMATGKTWLKIPSALLFILKNKPGKWVCGKDIILHIIGMLGTDGARYKSMEFCGDGLKQLSMDDRFTIANMTIEAGAKNGILETDNQTVEYEKPHRNTIPCKVSVSEAYESIYEIDLSTLRPVVAKPHSPANICYADELEDIKINQVVIGSCTNGRLSDLVTAAEILRERHVHRHCRTIIIPATQKIYLDALRLGLIETFIEAGCVVSTPTCGPCLGGHMGVLAKGERAISTTNRNFIGRMGHPESEVFLASPAVAAAAAIAGKIVPPDNI
ncbi:MAG: 3-isopropylmalate dehydratase large subunit [Clostridiales bacterium]|nr:3-isopropylmalate dehydratase large subunit [Clostridiales bacterium]